MERKPGRYGLKVTFLQISTLASSSPAQGLMGDMDKGLTGKVLKRLRGLPVLLLLILLWQAIVVVFKPAHFILPGPGRVASTLFENGSFLFENSMITLWEMLLGFVIGSLFGIVIALLVAKSKFLDRFLMPLVVTSQTLPVFAIAPILVIWFGFGIGSKIVMAALIIFFPVASAFHDGLKSVPQDWLDLSRNWGARRYQQLFKIEVPAALPHLGAGLKIAATVAPIGAVVGEWAGASGGLGFVMLQANARMQTDLVFASLLILSVLAWLLREITASLINHYVFWNSQPN